MIPEVITSEATKAVGKAIDETFDQPAQAFGQLISDKIQYSRWKSAIKIMQKAQKYAAKKGVTKLTQPDLKFFLPWAEGCSLEREDNDELQNLWSALLISEIENTNPNSLIYVDVLKKLNRTHVQFLKQLLGGDFPVAVGNPSISFGLHNVDALLKEPFKVGSGVAFSRFPEDQICTQIENINSIPGIELLVVSSGISVNRALPSNFFFEWIREEDADCEGDEPDLIYNSLAALNLVERHSNKVEVLSGIYLRYTASILSPLGWDFLRSCSKDI